MFSFKRKKIKTHETTPVGGSISKYKNIESDIKYLDSQLDDHVLNSLKSDFGIDSPDSWKATMNYDKNSTLLKSVIVKEGTRETRRYLRIEVSHSSDLINDFEVTKVELNINGGKYAKLDPKKFRNIILDYLMVGQLKSINRKLDETKESYNCMMEIIGKSTVRDKKIEDIFK